MKVTVADRRTLHDWSFCNTATFCGIRGEFRKTRRTIWEAVASQQRRAPKCKKCRKARAVTARHARSIE